VNGVDVGNLRCRDYGGTFNSCQRTRWANADSFVGKFDVERVAVGFAVDSYRADAEFTAGIDDAESNLTAIAIRTLRNMHNL